MEFPVELLLVYIQDTAQRGGVIPSETSEVAVATRTMTARILDYTCVTERSGAAPIC